MDEDEEAVRAEVAEDWKHFQAMKKQRRPGLEPIPVDGLTTDTFSKQGLKARSRVGIKSAGLIQSSLMASRALRPYIAGKLRPRQIARNFVIHDSDAEFESVYVKLHSISRGNPGYARRLIVGGFYHPPTDTIHLRSPSSRQASTLGDTVHEAMHKFSSDGSGKGSMGFRNLFGGFLDEGVTQFFTDVLLQEQGLGVHGRHQYQKQLACAKAVVRVFGQDAVGQAYFQAKFKPLAEAMAKRLGIQLSGFHSLRKGDALCQSLRKAGVR